MFRVSKTTLKAISLVAGVIALAVFMATPGQTALAQENKEGGTNVQQQQKAQQERATSQKVQRSSDMPQEDHNRWAIADEVIEGLIVTKLLAREGFNNIEVEVDDGVAELSGKVPSEAAKGRALRIVNRTFGIRSVRDQLAIDAPAKDKSPSAEPSEIITDDQLAERVARQIAKSIDGAKAGEDWWFDGWRVEGPYNRWNFVVEANGGDIVLDGEVPNFTIVTKAVETASDVAGVRRVDSDLEVEGFYGYPMPRYSPYSDPYDFYYDYRAPFHPRMMPPHASRSGDRSEPLADAMESQP